MTSEAIKKYTREIADANPTKIIVIVYELIEVYLDEAIQAHKNNDTDLFATNIKMASKCVNDLMEALDLQYDISRQLMEIYIFMNKEISLSIVRFDESSIVRIKTMATKLKKSFEELEKQDASGAVMSNAQEVYAGLTYGKGSLIESTNIQSNRGFTV